MAPAPRRAMGPLLPIILVVVLVVVAVIAYAGIGYAYAQGQESSARDSYNAVIGHANSYADTVNAMSSLNSNAFSASSIQQAKTAYSDLVSKSQKVQGQIDSDKAKLSDADSGLKQNSWLTVISKSGLDRWSTKIGHLEKALDSAKTISAGYVQVGTFYETVVDVIADLDTMTTKAEAQDLAGAQTAIAQLKTDTAKAISEDKAPGLPAEADTFMKDMQQLANDFGTVISTAISGDKAAYDAAVAKGDADLTSLQAIDTNKIDSDVNAYYKPMIDTYNNEINAANNA
jgi:hypothetical protein